MLARQKLFLIAMTLMGLLLLGIGAWRCRISGSVYELVLGAIMLALVMVAWVWWSKLARPSDHNP